MKMTDTINTIIPLKYPVVLVHGIAVRDGTGGIKSWGRIPETLTDKGIKVFLGNTDAWGEYESNAAILKQNIENALSQTGSEKVNIIAHSKGGIDSRYLIWKYDFGDKIASLTTLCTPHHGSEIADLLYNQKITHTKFTKKVLAVIGKLYGDTNPDLYSLNKQLTSADMKEFNRNVAQDDRVFYQSLSVAMNHILDDIWFFYSYLYIKIARGKNDGVVSEYSTKWGSSTGEIKGGISHAEIVDVKQRKISGIHIPGIFVNIVRDLQARGF